MKSQSGTSSFSLRDKLRSLRQKSTPSTSPTHHVALNGLKSDSKAKGEFVLQQIENVEAD